MARSVIAHMVVMVGGLFGFLSNASVLAQDDCAPVIQPLAEIVLEGRDNLPPLQARRFGTRAIYLLSRYGGLGDDEIDILLSEAVEARMHGASDLEMAWRVHRGTVDLSSEAMTAIVDTTNPSVVRALLLGGRAEAVITTIAALPEGSRISLGQLVVTVSFDQPDTVKAELAAAAADQGLDWLAAGYAAAQENPNAWSDYTNGMSADDEDKLISLWGWIPSFNGNPFLVSSTAPRTWRRNPAARLRAWSRGPLPGSPKSRCSIPSSTRPAPLPNPRQ